MKSNSPNTSLIVIFLFKFSIPMLFKTGIGIPYSSIQKVFFVFCFFYLFSLKFEIKMKRHKEKTYKVICFWKV